jgi:CPA2 family monovalent cation:H+ antiporter-2
MVLLIPLLAGEGGSAGAVLLVFGKALLLIAAVLVLARRVVPWILEHVAYTRRQELFLLTVVAICFGTAAASSYAGVSLALGAFLAGLVVSESRYREQALSEILPLRTVFNAVFFVSVGMLLDLSFLVENPLLVLSADAVAAALRAVLEDREYNAELSRRGRERAAVFTWQAAADGHVRAHSSRNRKPAWTCEPI